MGQYWARVAVRGWRVLGPVGCGAMAVPAAPQGAATERLGAQLRAAAAAGGAHVWGQEGGGETIHTCLGQPGTGPALGTHPTPPLPVCLRAQGWG